MAAPQPSDPPPTRAGAGTAAFVELIRLAVVVLTTAAAYQIARSLVGGQVLALVLVGAGVGYVTGGAFGRFALGRVDAAERRLRVLSSGELLAGVLGSVGGFVVGAATTWPVLLFGARAVTVPLAALVVLVFTATGLRVGLARGGDLLRYVGASGRVDVASGSSGPRAKVVDTSALIDGRLVDVCRAGFLEGTLVVPRFVLYELQGLADSGDDERRSRGRRGLDVLAALQRSARVGLEVSDTDYPEIAAVDAKLVALARERGAGLVTVDGNLGRVAEVQGVPVLNLHQLAETLRPPVLPGDLLDVRITKPGKERGQGVGYLADGTMVVVEGGRDQQGRDVAAEVTSILSNPNGRMVFATLRTPPAPPRALHGPVEA